MPEAQYIATEIAIVHIDRDEVMLQVSEDFVDQRKIFSLSGLMRHCCLVSEESVVHSMHCSAGEVDVRRLNLTAKVSQFCKGKWVPWFYPSSTCSFSGVDSSTGL